MTPDLIFETLGDGPPLLLLHGLFGSRSNWRGVARALSASHAVLSVDLRNHGESPWSDAMDYPAMADDVMRLIDRMKLERPTVLGHSMGGKAAMAFALMHPEQIGRLIVVDIAPVPYSDTLSPFVDAMRSINLMAVTCRADVYRALWKIVPDPSVVPFLMQNLVMINDRFDWRLNLVGIGAAMPRLCSFPTELMQLQCHCPTTVIVGEQSNYVTRHDGADFLPMFPRVEVEIVEKASHWVHADQPMAFLSRVRQALKSSPNSTRSSIEVNHRD